MSDQNAIVLLSGGLDSTTILAIAKSKGFNCYALSFSYGQRHSAELIAAKKIASHFGVREHKIVSIDLTNFGNSALTDHTIDVPKYSGSKDIPVTYVPARNTIFLSYALAWADTISANNIFIGASQIDYSNYPDCRDEYLRAFEKMANLGTKLGTTEGKIEIHAPLVFLSKAETVQLGLRLGVDYNMTVSCYQADEAGKACGICDSCVLRKKGFIEAKTTDQTIYQTEQVSSHVY